MGPRINLEFRILNRINLNCTYLESTLSESYESGYDYVCIGTRRYTSQIENIPWLVRKTTSSR
jgi:hypothetical protein